MKVMEKIKKNWKIIVIVLLLLFSMSKCSQSCNRQSIINNKISEIERLDSISKYQEIEINNLKRDTADYLNQIKMYQKFDSHRNLSDSINAANLAKQQEQNERLLRQNSQIINSLNKDK